MLLAVLALLVAAFAVQRPDAHAMLLGGAVGLLIAAVALTFQVREPDRDEKTQSSRPDPYSITS